ncbi:hypothetical protein T310_0169 [Rasamsonia emersonii CBS 393.64]|uniref:Aminoglycoside phosphotransferase domain-containing protein n=1 Tax=Rasamsonia emersonii (strain ATCC 16479 / CBS 393.64 / IMI 116815) TaxID=1408163 RepID=A0A0F4Z7F1_RASE3|nr:hypothetical protein T310_0169 [Rasamsonia emersonii CBS 393.64]KKA25783.1 hypothetical protein T310_0169 [Rasamsonia emersonii CBS 393.64]
MNEGRSSDLYFTIANRMNAVSSESDCVTQMTALALMRTIRPQFFDHNLNHGPFVFSLTDLDASNILVDKDWNIKCIIDLEWATVLPIEFMRTPIWLTGQAVDDIDIEAYNELRKEFMDAFKEEERKCPAEYNLHRASIMENWRTAGNQEPSGIPQLCGVRLGSMLSFTTGSNFCIPRNMPKTQTSLSSSANIGVVGQQNSSKRSSKTKGRMIRSFEKNLANSDAIRMMNFAESDCMGLHYRLYKGSLIGFLRGFIKAYIYYRLAEGRRSRAFIGTICKTSN